MLNHVDQRYGSVRDYLRSSGIPDADIYGLARRLHPE